MLIAASRNIATRLQSNDIHQFKVFSFYFILFVYIRIHGRNGNFEMTYLKIVDIFK